MLVTLLLNSDESKTELHFEDIEFNYQCVGCYTLILKRELGSQVLTNHHDWISLSLSLSLSLYDILVTTDCVWGSRFVFGVCIALLHWVQNRMQGVGSTLDYQQGDHQSCDRSALSEHLVKIRKLLPVANNLSWVFLVYLWSPGLPSKCWLHVHWNYLCTARDQHQLAAVQNIFN